MNLFIQDNAGIALLVGGLMIGAVFGAVLQRSNFCVMGGLSDAIVFGDRRRLYAWVLAAAIAILATQVLSSLGLIALERSFHLSSRFNWAGHILGGLIFGAGMVLAGGCASRNIIRAASGDLRALVLLMVIGVFAYATISGVFAATRVAFAGQTAIDLTSLGLKTQHAGDLSALALGFDQQSSRLAAALLLSLIAILIVFRHRPFRTSLRHVAAGIAIGVAVTAGWLLTSLAYDDFAARPADTVSLSFVRPLGDAFDWLQRSTALGLPEFGAATVFGTVTGALLAALTSRTFKLMTFADTADTLRHLAGGAMMGIGGVMALGCTIGQGISGVSTLGLGSFLATGSIATGAVWMIRRLAAS